MAERESTAKNFAIGVAVAVICSFAVSLTAVGLRARREGAQDLDRMKHVLLAAGLFDPRVPVARTFARVEPRYVDLESGEYVPDAAVDPSQVIAIPKREDIADIEKRERYVQVYLVRDMGRVTQIVLPVRGQGWSVLRAFVAIDRDLATIRGFTVYAHEETAGMGAEVDNPKWKARWPGKRLFDPSGRFRLKLSKGGADPAAAYEVDGISGATLTTEGIENMLRFWFTDHGYARFLERLEERGIDHG